MNRALALILLSIALLAACGSKDSAQPNSEVTKEANQPTDKASERAGSEATKTAPKDDGGPPDIDEVSDAELEARYDKEAFKAINADNAEKFADVLAKEIEADLLK
ncbi:MAG: hypothetical protein CMH57_03665 [Myxococcales bacterium]|nr:hypothetical protein [Myxococcales bacterium]